MLSILIIDDTKEKRDLLKNTLCEMFEEISIEEIDEAYSTNSGQQAIAKKQYDLVLLDLFIPSGKNDQPNPLNAANFLELLLEFDEVHMPTHILGITRMNLDEIPENQKKVFDNNLWALLKYADNERGWQEKLRLKVAYLIRSKKQLMSNPSYDYDVAIFNALDNPENKWVINTFGKDNWKRIEHPIDKTCNYYVTKCVTSSGRTIRIVTCTIDIMGASAAATVVSKMIYNFRPKYLFMTGIAAAANSDGGRINIGDIMIATEAIDKANGKFSKENGLLKFVPDPKSFHTDPAFLSIIDDVQKDKELMYKIHSQYPLEDFAPRTDLNLHKGQNGTVPAVVANVDVVNEMMFHNRYLQGIEMEAYGLYLAACYSVEPRPKAFASIKSVSDFADEHKENKYRDYAAYTSSAFLYYLINNKLEY